MHPTVALLTIFVLAAFTGYEVISKVSTTLHTPLMSGANAIHGIILVGAIIVTGHADTPLEVTLGLLATVLATLNMVGGFVVTDRMLQMFATKPRAAAPGTGMRRGGGTGTGAGTGTGTGAGTGTGTGAGRGGGAAARNGKAGEPT